MPPHHRVGSDEQEVSTPVPAQAVTQHPEQRVAPPEADAPPARWPRDDRQLVPQQQVLYDQITVPPAERTYDREDAQDEIEHPRSITDPGAPRRGQGFAVPQVLVRESYPPGGPIRSMRPQSRRPRRYLTSPTRRQITVS